MSYGDEEREENDTNYCTPFGVLIALVFFVMFFTILYHVAT